MLVHQFGVGDKAELISLDIKNYIEKLNSEEKFDLIFLDPPYKDKTYLEIISLIKNKKIVNKNHKIIIHRESKSQDQINKFLKVDIEKIYGRSKIIFGSF